MKDRFSRFFCCAALLPFWAVPHLRAQDNAANVVLNGGFEDWVPATSDQLESRKGKAFQWAALENNMTADNFDLVCERPGTPPAVRIVADENNKHGGNFSIRMESTNEDQIGSIYSKRFRVEPGKTYKLSVWYKMDSVSGNGVTIWVAQGRAANFSESSKSTLFRPEIRTGFSDWELYEATFEAPLEAEEANVCLQLQSSSGTVWFDDLEIVPVE